MTKKKKDFDAVEMKRRIQEKRAELVEGATPEEWLAFYNEGIIPERNRHKVGGAKRLPHRVRDEEISE